MSYVKQAGFGSDIWANLTGTNVNIRDTAPTMATSSTGGSMTAYDSPTPVKKPEPSWWDNVTGRLAALATPAPRMSAPAQATQLPAMMPGQASAGFPILPVVIGAGVLLFFAMKKKA